MSNCISLENINILKCSSNTCNKNNNKTNENVLNKISKDFEKNITFDHDYVFNYNISQYSKEIVIWINGFVSKKLIMNLIKCEELLFGNCRNQRKLRKHIFSI